MFRFVWRPQMLSAEAADAARRAGFRIVCDLTGPQRLEKAALLTRLADSAMPVDYWIDGVGEGGLPEAVLEALCRLAPTASVWVDSFGLPADMPRSLRELATDRLGWVVASAAELEQIRQTMPNAARFALKGNEAAGFVGADTIFTLFATVRDQFRRNGESVQLHVWGGVATPEAAAAFLTSGAAGVVFESLHWLTDQAGTAEPMKKKLRQLRADHTRVVGLNSPTPYRLYDKGNSAAARTADLNLNGDGHPDELRRYLQNHAVSPLDSRFDRRELIPLGVEASFAGEFVRQFGSDLTEACSRFQAAVRDIVGRRAEIAARFADSPVAKLWGTRFPFVQGAMSWISDAPEFAARIAAAGGLPTLALGLMDPDSLQRKLGNLQEVMGDRPYAVNVITLSENPCREAQLEWVRQQRPRFAVIAAGEPAQGRTLLDSGIDAIYIAPTEDLLQLALENGYRQVICEGCESGGHIGIHSTLTLAQLALILKKRRPELFAGRTLILAGGICNRETAYMAAVLGADAIQMGTVYLTATEIVETGALSDQYQQRILAAAPAATMVTGECVGLRVRSLRNEKTAAIQELEKAAATDGIAAAELRQRLERLATGSLCCAARGFDPRTGKKLSPARMWREGQFMSGACAGILRERRPLAELHAELAAPFLPEVAGELLTEPSEFRATERFSCNGPERIAITGMSLVNALGRSPAEIWSASLALRNGVVAVPAAKWDHERYFDSRPMVSGKTYCRAAAFHDLRVSRREIAVAPQDFKNMTEATKIALWVAGKAVGDSRILESDIARDRIGVILSQNVSEMTPISADLSIREALPDLLAAVRRVLPLTPEQEASLQKEMVAGRSIQDDTSLLGRLSSMVPGFVCNKFGFAGPSYSVQAACASSLVALHSAVQMMRNGLLDAAVVGGGEEPLSPLHFLDFSVLGALAGLSDPSRPVSAMSRPFDRRRDGFVMGEGSGMIVIERESVARSRGAHIYGYVTGVGASNTETGMVESSRHSQIRAIRASFAGLPYGPESVDLVECHATSTRQGDLEEVAALKSLYPARKRTVIAGFKSQIGHTLGAAGISSLIRGVMAMNAGLYPPTLNCDEPDPALQLDDSGLVVLKEPEPWRQPPGRPRRFQVDAFGFGGSNFVVQLEQAGDWETPATAAIDEPVARAITPWPAGLHDLSRPVEGILRRIAVLADTRETAEQQLKDSQALEKMPALTEKQRRALARQGVYIGTATTSATPAVAMVFPGQGAQYAGMGRELSEAFPSVRELLSEADGYFGFDVQRLLFETTDAELRNTRWQQPAVFALEVALARLLLSYGLRPAALAGHSLGQFAALCVAGAFSFADGCRIVNQRALCMEKAGVLAGDAGSMLAVHAGREAVEPLLEANPGVFVLNVNSPAQTVIGGATDATLSMAEILSERGLRWSRLPVGMAFHSPIFRSVQQEFADFLSTIPMQPPTIPVLSNHTPGVFPADAESIRRLLAEHMGSPVDWLANVRSLADHYRIQTFVEVGPREALGNLIRDTLPEPECLPLCLPTIEYPVFCGALARLFVSGSVPEPAAEGAGSAAAKLPASVAVTMEPTPLTDDAAILEAVIGVILQTTGYERDEVEPDMDLRDDLSIRSSRLPVIADALEGRFAINLDLQDFAGVRTVRDVAGRIERIRKSQADSAGGGARRSDTTEAGTGRNEGAAPGDATIPTPLRRLRFDAMPLQAAEPDYLRFSPMDRIGLFCPWGGETAAALAAAVLRRDHGVSIVPVATPAEAGDNLSGMILWIAEPSPADPAAVPALLRDTFLLLQAFLATDRKKAVLLFRERTEADRAAPVLAEGVLGMMLCMAWEYRSVLFRSVRIDTDSWREETVRRALDRNITPVSLHSRSDGLYVEAGQEEPLRFADEPGLTLDASDVVVVSGGGAGILREWVRSLIPFGCRIALLGRTDIENEPAGAGRAEETRALLAELKSAGIKASYHVCDVADAAQVGPTLASIARRWGRITGVVHGAGILRDNFVPGISAADFAAVTAVKLQGALNLSAAAGRGLRFFVAVSSVAAANGNPGQANYAAANRAMTAFVEGMAARCPNIRCRCLLLAPVEGGGMADTEELRALMRRSGYSYIHAAEAAAWFCRELTVGAPTAGPLLLARDLPAVPTAPPIVKLAQNLEQEPSHFALLDQVVVDLRQASLTAGRSFDAVRDLWLPEHRPLPDLKHPLVSGIMMLEAFAEAARELVPYLPVRGFRDVRFRDIIECPADRPRASRLDCRVQSISRGKVVCAAQLQTRDISPGGRELASWAHNSSAAVLLGPAVRAKTGGKPSLPPVALAGPGLDRTGLLALYEEYTGLTGRYRVLDAITGLGDAAIEARTVLRPSVDFAGSAPTRYQTPPYLLEAVFHAAVFQTLLTRDADKPGRIVLPYGFSAIDLHAADFPPGDYGVQAIRRSGNDSGVVWDAVVYAGAGRPVLTVRGLEMRWLSL